MQFTLALIEEFEQKYGLPIYVFDVKAFKDNYYELLNCFREEYPNYQIAYSYKTNYTPYICKLIKEMGGYAEVVSDMEYYIAKKLGYESDKIIFNGPNKGDAGIAAICDKSIVNVDSIEELTKIIDMVNEKPNQHFEIGIRINVEVGQDFISRFGMDRSDVEKAFKMVLKVNNLKIVGLHCHISRCRNLDAWKKRTETLLEYADQYFEEVPKYLDLGSGMFGKMAPEFLCQFDNVPSYKEYAMVTAKLIAQHYKNIPEEKKPILFTEPGTTVINKYVDFIGKIDAIKRINGKDFAILNCSEQNLGETCLLKKLPVEVYGANNKEVYYENIDFTGYTCLEQDVMYTGFRGSLAVGNYVVFGNVGGYSNVYKQPFIKPNCMMIAIEDNETSRIIKKKETFEDILHTYIF